MSLFQVLMRIYFKAMCIFTSLKYHTLILSRNHISLIPMHIQLTQVFYLHNIQKSIYLKLENNFLKNNLTPAYIKLIQSPQSY